MLAQAVCAPAFSAFCALVGSGANSVEVLHITPIPYSCEGNFSVNGSAVTVSDVNNLALMGSARTSHLCVARLCRVVCGLMIHNLSWK